MVSPKEKRRDVPMANLREAQPIERPISPTTLASSRKRRLNIPIRLHLEFHLGPLHWYEYPLLRWDCHNNRVVPTARPCTTHTNMPERRSPPAKPMALPRSCWPYPVPRAIPPTSRSQMLQIPPGSTRHFRLHHSCKGDK